MSLDGLTDRLLVVIEQQEARRRTGLSACLCLRCDDWAEIDSNYCQWCGMTLFTDDGIDERSWWRRMIGGWP